MCVPCAWFRQWFTKLFLQKPLLAKNNTVLYSKHINKRLAVHVYLNNLLRVTMKGYCQSAAANEGNLRWTMHNYFWFYATTWPWKTRQAAHRRQKICMVVKVNSDKGHAWTILLHDTEIQLMIWMLNLAHACAVALTLLLMLHAWSACNDKTPCSCKFGGNWSW